MGKRTKPKQRTRTRRRVIEVTEVECVNPGCKRGKGGTRKWWLPKRQPAYYCCHQCKFQVLRST